jgi:Holliday junction resolvasome RuvABC DNA-binding subunit
MAGEARPEAAAPVDEGAAVQQLTALPGVGEKLAMRLVAAGFSSLAALADATPEALQEIEGIGPKSAEKILLAARDALGEASAAGLAQGAPAEASAAPDGPAREAK